MRNQRVELRVAIAEKGVLHGDLAYEVGLPQTKLSRIVIGWIEPRWHEKESIAKVLKVPVDKIFPERRRRVNA